MRSVVQLYPGPPLYRGAVAQLGERLVCNQEATGSIPVSSTRIFQPNEAIDSNSVSGPYGDHVGWLDSVVDISRGVEADSVVGAFDLYSDIRSSFLRSVQGILAARAEA